MIVRAPAGTALSGLLGVKLNAGGSIVPSGTSDARGVFCYAGTIAAGSPGHILIAGEIVELGGTASVNYYAGPAGTIRTLATDGSVVGFAVEADRLVVHM